MHAIDLDIEEELEQLKREGLYRQLIPYDHTKASYLNFSTNDYLGLASDSRVIQGSQEHLELYGASSRSSRLVTGSLSCHHKLEYELAQWLGVEQSLICGAGFLANLSLIPTLARRNDVIFSDRLVHASLVDGIQLSQSTHKRFRHNDLNHLEDLLIKANLIRRFKQRFIIVTESVFSMDGDLASLKELLELAHKFSALIIVDEAHAIGVFGPEGRGLLAANNLSHQVTAISCTLSKALASYGGVVACSEAIKSLVINRGRAFIYNTSLAPSAVGAARAAVQILKTKKNLGLKLLENAEYFRSYLTKSGLDTMRSQSQIIPLLVRDNAKAVAISLALKEKGIMATAIRPPTVPVGTARLRFSLNLSLTQENLDYAMVEIVKVAREFGL